MSEPVTKTLEATLATPTQGKECRLQRLLDTYREALAEAFDTHADTMSTVNDIVTPYDLPYQAKDALKSYVPKLFNTYNAQEIDNEHPLRLVNRAATFDYSDERHHSFVWQVPQPGRGTNFWIPLQINPDQESLWEKLLDSDAEAGELRLHRHRRNWVLHITVDYPVAEPDESDDPTYIGFDIGEAALITGCALKRNTPTKPFIDSGSRARHLRKEMHTTLKRLQERDAAQWRIDERFEHHQNTLTDIVEKASRQAVEYARKFDSPVIVLEDLSYIRERLDYGNFMNRRLHAWAFARLQGRIEDKAAEARLSVEYVNAAYTSQTCHECGHIGSRGSQAEFRCTNDDCHISEFQADINAVARTAFWLAARFQRNLATAANIASRVDPWSESVPWEPERDDTPQDGSGCDTATVHRETSVQSTQMTLTAFQD